MLLLLLVRFDNQGVTSAGDCLLSGNKLEVTSDTDFRRLWVFGFAVWVGGILVFVLIG